MSDPHDTPVLDVEVCERARLSRDARFDGRFFIGVRTTRIYCRPVCPVKPPLARNVVFFPTAAAAAEAGFRPCLRCRPEQSSGTPDWCGVPEIVGRAKGAWVDRIPSAGEGLVQFRRLGSPRVAAAHSGSYLPRSVPCNCRL